MRCPTTIAAAILYSGLVGACAGESAEKKTENAENAEDAENAENADIAAGFRSATPVEVDAAELAAMYAPGSKHTELQRGAKEEELKGKVVEWKGLRVHEVNKEGDDCFRVQTSATDTHPGVFLTVCSSDDAGIAKLAPALMTDDFIDVRGLVDGISMRHIELKPATVAKSSDSDNLTRVCRKLAQLAAKEPDLPEAAKNELADLEKCREELGEYQKDPESFKKRSDCVMLASDMEGLLQCAIESEGLGE